MGSVLTDSIVVDYIVTAAAGVIAAAVIAGAAVSAVSSGTLTLLLQKSGHNDASAPATEEPETLNQSNGNPTEAPRQPVVPLYHMVLAQLFRPFLSC